MWNENSCFVYISTWRILIWHNFDVKVNVYVSIPVATFVASSLWRGRGPSWLWYTESRFCCVASCVKKIGLADKFAIFFVTWPLSIKLQDWNVSLKSDFFICLHAFLCSSCHWEMWNIFKFILLGVDFHYYIFYLWFWDFFFDLIVYFLFF